MFKIEDYNHHSACVWIRKLFNRPNKYISNHAVGNARSNLFHFDFQCLLWFTQHQTGDCSEWNEWTNYSMVMVGWTLIDRMQNGVTGIAMQTPESETAAIPGSSVDREWTYGLCGCFSDWRLCITTFVAPCVTTARNAEYLGEPFCRACVLSTLCFPYGLLVRYHLRLQEHIQGSMTRDMATHLLLPCCALVQESREISEARREESDLAHKAKQLIAPSYDVLDDIARAWHTLTLDGIAAFIFVCSSYALHHINSSVREAHMKPP